MQAKLKAEKSPLPTKGILITLAILYLAFMLLIPVIAVFYEAFHKGLGGFLEAISERDFLHAVQLTLLVTAITVPLNTIFGLSAAWVIARNQFPG